MSLVPSNSQAFQCRQNHHNPRPSPRPCPIRYGTALWPRSGPFDPAGPKTGHLDEKWGVNEIDGKFMVNLWQIYGKLMVD